jgi:hypothetical protein
MAVAHAITGPDLTRRVERLVERLQDASALAASGA